MVSLKPGVVLDRLAPAAYVILDAIREASIRLGQELTVTCGNEAHPATDPHSIGEAIDVRSKPFGPDLKLKVLDTIMQVLAEWHGEAVVSLNDTQRATAQFFGQLENLGFPTEHFHIQRRKNTKYTIEDLLA